ncbi:hypothetical protein BAJUN_01470 [Bajunvirus bajun]|uniref:Uncharacterized protein n=1 Tax=Brevundimonas phage vB_BgoS-Bajun TaxID=2948594 RepID=A0A9E7N723_9CAUD|nr:hypothetical protein BAJUN_01470 [Brevundimonas phage vB_BgoS-Bajun]
MRISPPLRRLGFNQAIKVTRYGDDKITTAALVQVMLSGSLVLNKGKKGLYWLEHPKKGRMHAAPFAHYGRGVSRQTVDRIVEAGMAEVLSFDEDWRPVEVRALPPDNPLPGPGITVIGHRY